MEVEVLDASKKGEWEDFLHECERTIAWQSFEWSALLGKHYRFEFYPLAARESGRIRGILPLYRISASGNRSSLISVPHAVAGGIASECGEARRSLLEKAVEIYKNRGAGDIVLKQYKYKMDGDLRTDDKYYNRELTLSVATDRLLAGFSGGNRAKIGETEGTGYVLEYPSGDIESFHLMLLRHLHTRGIPCVSKSWIASLVGSGMYSLAMLRSGGNVRAATLIKLFKKTVSFPFTCCCEKGDEKYIYRLYWELLKVFSSQGKEIFHSGRIPAGDATDEYRLGWGGVAYNYYYQYYPNIDRKTEYSNKRGGKRRVLEAMWKAMPAGVAKVLGPIVVKRFP